MDVYTAGTVDLSAFESADLIDKLRVDEAYEVAPAGTAPSRYPSWLRMVTNWHAASRSPVPIALDCALGFGVIALTTRSTRAALAGTTVLLLAGLLFGIWKQRTEPETQGVSWILLPLARITIAAGVVLRIAVAGTTDRRAALAIVVLFAVLAGVRAALWQVIGFTRRHGFGVQSVLVIGPPDLMDEVEHRLGKFPEAGLRFAASYTPTVGDAEASPVAGRLLVDRLLKEHSVQHVLCIADDIEDVVYKDFVRFGRGRVDVSVVLPLSPLFVGGCRAYLGDWGIVPVPMRPSWGSDAVKRLFDISASLVLLILMSPLLALTAIAIRLGTPGPAIYKQQRVGHHGKTFTIYKFRSMVAGADSMQGDYMHQNVHESLLFKVPKDPRVTRLGNMMRRFSIDELPQLFNVLKGDMSLVGPRPLAVDPDAFDTAAQIRHQVLPGITGLWQVHGGNALPYDDMVELDLTYVATRSLGTDLMLLLKTVPALLVRRGPY